MATDELSSPQDRYSEGVVDGPAFCEPHADCTSTDAGKLSPHTQWVRRSVMGNHVVFSGISSLLKSRCPAAIARFIVAVIVGVSVQGVSAGWARPHVGQEVLEAICRPPSAAHANAATSVIGVSSRPLIVASPTDTFPNPMLARAAFAMLGAPRRAKLTAKAPATLRCAIHQLVGANVLFLAALASAEPERAPWPSRLVWPSFPRLGNDKPPDGAPGKVDELTHCHDWPSSCWCQSHYIGGHHQLLH